MKFTLTINMGNAAMCEGWQIAEALKLQVYPELQNAGSPGDIGTVLDENGNAVGLWKIEE